MRRRKHTIPDHRSIQDPGRLVSEIKEVQFKCTNRGTLVYKRRIKHLITRKKACTVKRKLKYCIRFSVSGNIGWCMGPQKVSTSPRNHFYITWENSAKYISKYAETGRIRLGHHQAVSTFSSANFVFLPLFVTNYYAINIYFRVCLRNKFRISALLVFSLLSRAIGIATASSISSMLASFFLLHCSDLICGWSAGSFLFVVSFVSRFSALSSSQRNLTS